METLQAAILAILAPRVLGIAVLSAVYGILVGAIPGLTATMAVALVVPMTFFMSDVEAVVVIVTTVTCSIFAGDIPATLVRIPGTPASAAYANDAYALTQRHLHEQSLVVALCFSVMGGLFGAIVLASSAPLLAMFAASFTSFEYFWLYVLGLTCAVMVSDQSFLKGVMSLLLGMLLATVGLGTDFSTPRLTFGYDELITGIEFIPAMIGLFGVSEIFRNALYLADDKTGLRHHEHANETQSRAVTTLRQCLGFAWSFLRLRKLSLLRSSLIGSVVGMLPGAGADIAAWIAYAVSKRFSRHPERYGQGSLEGIADATGANNAALGSAWIPALVFGIPGDSVTAIAIGVLLMKNITPGPDIFDFSVPSPQAVLVVSILLAFLVANIVLIPVGLCAVRLGSWLVRIPRRVLLPLITLFCIVGAFSMQASYFDVWVMLAMGGLGFLLERYGFPLGPAVLGIILGGQVEHRFIQCISLASHPGQFLANPLSCLIAVLCLVLWLAPLLGKRAAS